MGRVTVFGTAGCPHCTLAKAALQSRNIPYVEIDLERYPSRRNDVLSLSDRLSVPQVFFNDRHVGGADDLITLLEGWERQERNPADAVEDPLEKYRREIESQPDPDDRRLRLPTSEDDGGTASGSIANLLRQQRTPEEINCVRMPNGQLCSVLDVTQTLRRILDSRDRHYQARTYRSCFVNTEAVEAIAKHYQCSTEGEAVEFGRLLQNRHKVLDHVWGHHDFTNDGHYFFRLQCYSQPDVLNSYRIWTDSVETDPEGCGALMLRLKRMLDTVIGKHTDTENGLVDYLGARQDDEDFPVFEEAVCELQAVNMGKMSERGRLVFGINVYNLMIAYAFVKVGVGITCLNRNAFFSRVKFNIGGELFSFNDLEHGVLRRNARQPFAVLGATFGFGDPRVKLALSKVDCRIHFALNCGAKSCPPIKFFRAESVEEELRVVALSFCESDDNVMLDEGQHTVTVSAIFKWFERDFCISKDKLPEVVAGFLRNEKKRTLVRMIETSVREKKPISVRYHPYDWSVNASRFKVYSPSELNNPNEINPVALLSSDTIWNCLGRYVE